MMSTNHRQESNQQESEEPKKSHFKNFVHSLPCNGIYKLILTGICIILTVMISSDKENDEKLDTLRCVLYVTIYISFSISGLLDIIIFYLNKDLLPKNIDSFSLVIAFLVEYLIIPADEKEGIVKSVSSCLVIAILGCLMSSVLMLISSSSMTTFSLSVLSMIQGTWLMHSAYLTCSEKMSYLYFSWHVLAVASISIAVNVIMQLQAGTQVKKHMAAKHTRLTTTVDTDSYRLGDVHTAIPILEQKKKEKEDKALCKSAEHLCDDKVVDKKAAASDSELNSSFESIPTEVLYMHSDKCERISPLQEFNNLHNHSEGVRRDIKVKDSSIV
jgi:hypothetical protein